MAGERRPLRDIAWWPPLRALLDACLGWLVLGPLTWIVPRRRELVVFFGRDGGTFSDNCKYLFAALHARPDLGLEAVYLCRDDALRDRLRALGARAETAASLAGYRRWLRAGTIVVDNIDWIARLRFAGSRGARRVQLWHGIPLKLLQLPLFEERLRRLPAAARLLLRLQRAVIGRFPRYDWLLSTAPLVTDTAFAHSFRYGRVSHAGYPRNDALFAPPGPLAGVGVDEAALAAVDARRAARPDGRIGLYAPTFRDDFTDPFAHGRIDLAALSRMATQRDVLLLVKLHPWMHGRVRTGELPGLHFVAPASDPYPLLRQMDFLVTDYSSIHFDYLLLDRPVVYFPYDLEHYLANERAMYFDYDAMTPGPKVRDVDALSAAIAAIAAGEDGWRGERARVRALVFAHAGPGAGDRLLAELFGPSARDGAPLD